MHVSYILSFCIFGNIFSCIFQKCLQSLQLCLYCKNVFSREELGDHLTSNHKYRCERVGCSVSYNTQVRAVHCNMFPIYVITDTVYIPGMYNVSSMGYNEAIQIIHEYVNVTVYTCSSRAVYTNIFIALSSADV